MRLAMVINDLGSGGSQRALCNLAIQLVNDGHYVKIITISDNVEVFYHILNNIEVECVSFKKYQGTLSGLLNNFCRISSLRKLIKSGKYDLAVGFISRTNALLVLASIFLKVKVIVSERNDPEVQSQGKVWDYIVKLCYSYADVITANSSSAVKFLKKRYPHKRVRYIPNTIKVSDIIKEKVFHQKIVLAVGRLHSQKRYDLLIDGFSKFLDRNPGWRLVILGEGDQRDLLIEHAVSSGISKVVDFKGAISNVDDYYVSSTVFVLCSDYEGMPNALLEAMSFGLPSIVSSKIKCIENLVINNSTGLIFNGGDSSSLADCLELYSINEPLWNDIRELSHTHIENYNPGKGLNVWYSIFEDAISK